MTVHVRPKGYVADEAVVARIGERDLFLGNRHAADPERCEHEFDRVLSVNAEAGPATTHHRPLTDGPGNAWERFAGAVDTARELRTEGTLLVNCEAGISRSCAVTATTIAADEGRTFHDALAAVQDARPHAVPHPALHELGVVYLAARGKR